MEEDRRGEIINKGKDCREIEGDGIAIKAWEGGEGLESTRADQLVFLSFVASPSLSSGRLSFRSSGGRSSLRPW